MDYDARGFVDDDDVFVFVEDLEGDVFRLCFFGLFLGDVDLDLIAG